MKNGRMYVETLGYTKEVKVWSALSGDRIEDRFIPDQFNVVITDQHGKQLNKYKIKKQTLRKQSDPIYFLIEKSISESLGFNSLKVYCDLEEIENSFHALRNYRRVDMVNGKLVMRYSYEDEMETLAERLRHHRYLSFHYDEEVVEGMLQTIVW